MSQKITLTILWMVIFPAVAFLINGIAFLALDHLPSFIFPYFVWITRILFYISPLVALFLGARGSLPGTKPQAIALRDIMPLLLGLIVAGLVARLTWIVFHLASRPDVSISFLGYTNDVGGTRLAGIAVTNQGSSSIFVYLPIIEVQAPDAWKGFINYYQGGTNQSHRFHSILDKGASGSFIIPPPPFKSSWRLSFFAYPDVGASRFIKRFGVYTYIFLGLRPRYQTMPFGVESDWIESDVP